LDEDDEDEHDEDADPFLVTSSIASPTLLQLARDGGNDGREFFPAFSA
jgi:hypothetical protein